MHIISLTMVVFKKESMWSQMMDIKRNDYKKTNGNHTRSVNVSGLSWEIAPMKDENGNDIRFDFFCFRDSKIKIRKIKYN